MTPELMAVFIRKVWAKRPTKTPFRDTNLLGMDGHYSHVDEAVLDTLKTVCNTSVKISPASMTGLVNGPDTHWNKPFKGYMREEMDEYLDSEEYEFCASGKIKPAPYAQICDWVVAAWKKIDKQVIVNSFVQNGWQQAFNKNDTSVLHSTLRELVDNNITRGYQRRPDPEMVEAHNVNIAEIKGTMFFGDDVDDAEAEDGALDEEDDFDFYRLQSEEDASLATSAPPQRTLPIDDIDFSAEDSDIDLDADVTPTLTPTRNMEATSQADTGSGSELEF